jgi:hypothetical protein
VARELEVDALTDEERIRLLRAAAEEARTGRTVRCDTPDEVRKLMDGLTSPE